MSVTYLLLEAELEKMDACPRQGCDSRELLLIGFDSFECTKCGVRVTTRCQRCGKRLVASEEHPAVSCCPKGCNLRPVLVMLGDWDRCTGHVSLKDWLDWGH